MARVEVVHGLTDSASCSGSRCVPTKALQELGEYMGAECLGRFLRRQRVSFDRCNKQLTVPSFLFVLDCAVAT